MSKQCEPCRLRIHLAREAPVGLVFRRGPSKWVQVLRWNLNDDTFEPGQWMHGEISDFASDLSPDGRYILYRASKNYARLPWYEDNVFKHWTAVSRLPYLTTLAFWLHDSWAGGGFFISDHEILLDFSKVTHPPTTPETGEPVPNEMQFDAYAGGQTSHVPIFNAHLHQHGWRETEVEVPAEHDRGTDDPVRWTPQHFIKGDGAGGQFQLTWSMFRWSNPAFGIHDRVNKSVSWLPTDTEWADWDGRHRLVWAQGGKIWAMSHASSFAFGLTEAKMLIDLNPNRPQGIISPEWTRQW